MTERAKIRFAIYLLAVVILVALGIVRWWGIDPRVFKALAICGGLLVIMLLMTYRVLASIADAATARAAADEAAQDQSGNSP
jgi:hypothetical protein